MDIGLQLFTLKDYCKDLAGFSETLKRVADIGYKNVQVSGTADYEPAWLKEKLKECGLTCVLTHVPEDKLLKQPQTVANEHDVFNCKYIGLGYTAFAPEKAEAQFDNFLKKFTPVVDVLFENGKYFMYHNHDQEFIKSGGKPILQKISEAFDKRKFGFTLDTFWVQAGGGNPAEWAEILSGRIPCVHLKDYAYGKKMAVLGEGNINFDKFFYAAEAAGTKYMLVEQDNCNGQDPFDCIKRSYDYLVSRGF